MNQNPFDGDKTPILGTMLLEASAGTGKTYALEHIVARLIGQQNIPIDQILVVTFTNKTAQEMKSRIRQLISQKASADRSKDNPYITALSSFDSASIYTIHGFCRMVLATWPFESCSPFHQEVVPGNNMEVQEAGAWLASQNTATLAYKIAYKMAGSVENLWNKIAGELASEKIPPGSRMLPDQAEMEATSSFLEQIQNPESRLCQYLKRLTESQWSQEAINNIFKLAQKNKIAKSITQIQEHLIAIAANNNLEFVTIAHDIFDQKHCQELMYAAWISNPEKMPEEQTESLELMEIIKEIVAHMKPLLEIQEQDFKIISQIENSLNFYFLDNARNCVEKRSEERKEESGIWGYKDLIRRVHSAVTQTPSLLKDVLQKRYKAVLIDEFQDTDSHQWEIFKTLFCTPQHILVLIGDPKQNIFGFRGTGLQTYNSAIQSVIPSRRFQLDTNYRSHKNLVVANNFIFGRLFGYNTIPSLPVEFSTVKSGLENIKPVYHIHQPNRPNSRQHSIETVAVESIEEYMTEICNRIRQMLDTATGAQWLPDNPDHGTSKPVVASDIAILVRNNKQEETIIEILAKNGIPAISYRERSIFNQPIVKSLIELLQAIEEPRDISRWRTVLLGRFFLLPADLLYSLEQQGLLDQLVEKGLEWKDRFTAGNSLKTFEHIFAWSSILGKWVQGTGREQIAQRLSKPWTKRVLGELEGSRHWQDWRHLCDLLQQKQTEGLKDISGILAWIKKSSDSKNQAEGTAVNLETEEPAVRVMTMHTAKGLEFPLVFLVGGFKQKTKRNKINPYRFDEGGTLVVDRLCRRKNFHKARCYEWEEEKRLWYVALTRAIYKLWIPMLAGNSNLTFLDSFWQFVAEDSMSNEDHNCSTKTPPHEEPPKTDFAQYRDSIAKSLLSQCPEINRTYADTKALPPLTTRELPDGRLSPLPAAFTGSRDPVTSSYSSLIRQLKESDQSLLQMASMYDDDDLEFEESPLFSERGSIFGSYIHKCLEDLNFSLACQDSDGWNREVDHPFMQIAGRYYPPGWYACHAKDIKFMIQKTLQADIPNLGRLCDLESSGYRSEVNFLIYLPQRGQLLSELQIAVEKGFLNGFIDVLVCKDNRWWVIDWKTNLRSKDQTWDQVMDSHHYHLQYELYLLSVCRSLAGSRNRPVNWDKEIGGAAYLFTRDLMKDNNGVFLNKPDFNRIQTLAHATGCGEIVE